MHCQLLRVHIIKFPMTFFQKYFFIVVSWKIYQKVAISPIPGFSGCHFGRSRAIFEKSFWLILSYLCKNWSKMLKCEILLFFVRKWLEWFKNPWYWYQEPRKLVGGWKFWKFEKMGSFWATFGPLWGRFKAALGLLWGCFRTTLGLLWGRFRTTLGMLLGCIEAASGTLRGTSGMLRGHSGAPVLWGLGPLYSALLLGITIQIAYSGSWDWRVFSLVSN